MPDFAAIFALTLAIASSRLTSMVIVREEGMRAKI
jgi:hypothetical protein